MTRTADEIQEGQVWRVHRSGEHWKVVQARYGDPAAYRMVLLDDTGEQTDTFDTVWAAELYGGAELLP